MTYGSLAPYLLGIFFAVTMPYASRFMPTRLEQRYWTIVMALVVAAFPPFPLLNSDTTGFGYELAALGVFAALLIASRWVAVLLPVVFLLHGSWDLMHLMGAVAIDKPYWITQLCVPFDWIVAGYLLTRRDAWQKGRPGMHPQLRDAFDAEMSQAREEYHSGRLDAAFSRLERAHVLGQRYAGPHTLTHYWMLRVGLRRLDAREILGQLLRIPTGAVGSAIGLVPTGNTGGVNVPATQRIPIPDDMKRLLDLDSE